MDKIRHQNLNLNEDRRWTVAVLGIVLTLFFTWREYEINRHEAQLNYDRHSDSIRTQIENKLLFYDNLLYQARAHLMAQKQISREAFREYVNNISLIEKFPGIQGLSFIRRIKATDLKKHEQTVRQSGISDYSVWPLSKKEEYFAIFYLEPNNWRNQRALGFDMYSEEVRRTAMEKAWLTGKPSMSRRLTLVQETDRNIQPGLILFLPVYADHINQMTNQQRRETLIGFLASPFRTRDLFGSIFDKQQLALDIEIYDGEKIGIDNLLYDYDRKPHFLIRHFSPRFTKVIPLNFAGQSFVLHTSSLPLFEKAISNSHFWIFFGGLIVTSLLFGIFHRIHLQALESQRLHNRYVDENQRLKSVLKQMPSGVIITDAKGRTLMRNDQLEIMLGPSRDLQENYVSNLEAYNTMGTKLVAEAWPLTRTIQKGETIRNEELKIVNHEGKESMISINSAPIRDDKNHIVAGVAIVNDITEQKKILSDLQEAIMIRDEFMSVASHELKTPLTSLKLQTQLLKRKVESSNQGLDALKDKITEVLHLFDKQIGGLNRLVEDMLDMSRLRTGKLNIEVTSCSMDVLIKEVIETLKMQMQDTGYTIPEMHFSGNLNGQWDRGRLTQVLTNLLSNSLKYGNKQDIVITATGLDDKVKVTVTDQGIGISAEDQERIFDRFERAVSPAEVSGLGLGLFIAKQIVKAHGGSIWVKSELQHGSTFGFEIPRRPELLH